MFTVDHIGIIVKDAEKSRQFYQKAFGFRVVDEHQDERIHLIFLELDGHIVELVHYLQKPAEERGAGAVDHIAFTVPDLEAAIAHVRSVGALPAMDAPLNVGKKKIYFLTGPDGERLELCEIVEG